jgi:hypothetical protein
MSARTMKRMSSRKNARASTDELRREYRFNYRKSRSNRFAGLVKAGSIAVVLEPDVASVFRSSKDVNALLRSVISALPSKPQSRPRVSRKAG